MKKVFVQIIQHEIEVSCSGEFLTEGSYFCAGSDLKAQLEVEADSVSGLRWHLVNEPCINTLVLEITAVCLYDADLWTVIKWSLQWGKQTYSLLKVYIKTNIENVLSVHSSILSRFSFVDLLLVPTVWWENNMLLIKRKTVFDALRRNSADFKPGFYIHIPNI